MRRRNLAPIVAEIRRLRERLSRAPRFVWATVTATSPLRIRVDGDENPLAGTPSRTVGSLTNGQRVFCVIQNGRCTIIGRAGG